MKRLFIPCLLSLLLPACQNGSTEASPEIESQQHAIVNGQLVTGDDHLATTMLATDVAERYGDSFVPWLGEYRLFCSSTLITPNWILTAAHCICVTSPDETVEQNRQGVYVFLAQSPTDIREKYEIEAFYPHPGYNCTDGENTDLTHDIALLKLKTPVPLSSVKPIAPLPPFLAITATEVDSTDGVTVVDVGFGLTHDETDENSAKHEMISQLYAYCPTSGPQSNLCNTPIHETAQYLGETYSFDYPLSDGFLYTRKGYGSHSSTCSGDSGGSTYLWRNNIPYVAGVHSFVSSYDCDDGTVNGNTIVSDYYDNFISEHVHDLPANDPETDCKDNIDNNNDGRLDCEDPWCYHLPVCMKEICDDKIDNNGDDKIDCDDPMCANAANCQSEICDDKIDNNGDDKIDCDDPMCANATNCLSEICDDKIDNNGDDKIDCDDPTCANALNCLSEICDDKIDNNGDDKIDCNDPQCADKAYCQADICDCSDLNCKHFSCIEICDDKIDNNGDDKIDCNDPRCADAPHCHVEVCDDEIDNNGDGFVDCDDPQCAEADTCHSSGGCSATPLHANSAHHGLWLIGLLGLLGLRRKRHNP